MVPHASMPFTNPEKVKRAPVTRRRSQVTAAIHKDFPLWREVLVAVFSEFELDEGKDCIIDHIHIIGLYSFADQRPSVMTLYLLGA